jgi:cytochrome bd-type quinol oxidase subunit 2
MKRSQWLYEIITYLLILLFLFTALSKLMDWHHFVRKMNNQVFIKPVASVLAIVVPAIEIIAAGLLIWIRTRTKGLWLSFTMMAAFTVYVGLATFKIFPRVPCSCAGAFDSMSWTQHLLFNLVFTLLAGTAIMIDKQIKISGKH